MDKFGYDTGLYLHSQKKPITTCPFPAPHRLSFSKKANNYWPRALSLTHRKADNYRLPIPLTKKTDNSSCVLQMLGLSLGPCCWLLCGAHYSLKCISYLSISGTTPHSGGLSYHPIPHFPRPLLFLTPLLTPSHPIRACLIPVCFCSSCCGFLLFLKLILFLKNLWQCASCSLPLQT